MVSYKGNVIYMIKDYTIVTGKGMDWVSGSYMHKWI